MSGPETRKRRGAKIPALGDLCATHSSSLPSAPAAAGSDVWLPVPMSASGSATSRVIIAGED